MKTPILREDGDMKCLKIEDNKGLNDNRTRFKDESHAQYKEAIEKYS